jgi:hypothetical protein
VICGGFAERIDVPLGAPLKGWADADAWFPNYDWEYDPLAAAAMLDAKFPEGTTPNPHYDAGFPGSAEFIRQYPAGHSKEGLDLDPLIFAIRTDDLRRMQAGNDVSALAKKHGLPVEDRPGPSAVLYPMVMDEFDYHLYTGGWNLGRFPTYAWGLWHSDNYFPSGSNYYTGYDCAGNHNWPIVDTLTEGIYYAGDYAEAVDNWKNFSLYHEANALNVPIFSAKSYWTYSTDMLGVVNMNGYGLENGWNFLNAYPDRTPGDTMVYAIKTAPNAMNIMYSSWYYDYQVHDRMHDGFGISIPPYDLSADQAGSLQDWTITTWNDGVDDLTRMTRYLRTDWNFTEPVTGAEQEQVNAWDYLFSMMYSYATDDGWNWDTVADIDHVLIPDDDTIDIHFTTLSYWNAYRGVPYIINKDVWLQSPLATHGAAETFTYGTDMMDTEIPVAAGPVVWVESVTLNGSPLPYSMSGWMWVRGAIHVMASLTNGDVVVIDYWGKGDALGYTPGNLPWQTIFEGAGPYYCTGFTPGPGGSAALKANRRYFQETPALGDIDFVSYWDTGSTPRAYAFRIDIFDVVAAAGAYGSSGATGTDTRYIAGADLAAPGCAIDIFDIVTITGKYNEEWGRYP